MEVLEELVELVEQKVLPVQTELVEHLQLVVQQTHSRLILVELLEVILVLFNFHIH